MLTRGRGDNRLHLVLEPGESVDQALARIAAATAREVAAQAASAQQAATAAEQAQNSQTTAASLTGTGPTGEQGVVVEPAVTDEVSSDGDCTGTHTGSDAGCEITLHHHLTCNLLYLALTCPLAHVTATQCIGFYTVDYLGSVPFDRTYTNQVHIDGWSLTATVLQSFAEGMVSDFAGCAQGKAGDCAWVALTLVAPPVIKALGRGVIAMRAAILAGEGIAEARANLLAAGASAETMTAVDRAIRAVTASGSGANLTPIDELIGDAVQQTTNVSCGAACVEMLSDGEVTQAQVLAMFGNRELSIGEVDAALGSGWQALYALDGTTEEVASLNATGRWGTMLMSPGGFHFVVVDGAESTTSMLKILDPWNGSSYMVTFADFDSSWTLYTVARGAA
jgi:hypothetical protein